MVDRDWPQIDGGTIRHNHQLAHRLLIDRHGFQTGIGKGLDGLEGTLLNLRFSIAISSNGRFCTSGESDRS